MGLRHFQYRFHGVGQGLFSSGVVISGWCYDKQNVFRWVYDCGTSHDRDKKLLREAIKFETPSRADPRRHRINLIVLSHFDSDHISGVTELLHRNEGVDFLMIPYLTVQQRLGIIASHAARGIRLEHSIAQAILNPTRYFARRIGSGRLVYVLPGEPEAARAASRQDLDRPYEVTDPPRDGGVLESPKVDFVKSGTPMRFVPDWEFLPYDGLNPRPTRVSIPFTSMLLRLRRLSALLIGHRSSLARRAKAVEQIQRQYDRAYGRAERNRRSLFLWAGPVTAENHGVRRISSIHSYHRYHRLSPGRSRGRMCLTKGRCAILYTGDGLLKDVDKTSGSPKAGGDIARLKSFYGLRMKSLGTLQVMHHGSKYNWSKGVARILGPRISVFSSDPSRPPHHPHAEVWRDFSKTTRLQSARGRIHCIDGRW